MKNYVAVCLLLLSLTITGSAETTDPLEAGFRSPPHDAKALTWWHWQDGNITREGITSDLEAMDEAGLAGAYLFSVSLRLPKGPARFMSPEAENIYHPRNVQGDRSAAALRPDWSGQAVSCCGAGD